MLLFSPVIILARTHFFEKKILLFSTFLVHFELSPSLSYSLYLSFVVLLVFSLILCLDLIPCLLGLESLDLNISDPTHHFIRCTHSFYFIDIFAGIHFGILFMLDVTLHLRIIPLKLNLLFLFSFLLSLYIFSNALPHK